MRDLTPARRAVSEAAGQSHFQAAVVLGSGLSSLAASLVGGEPIPYSGIPGMPVSTVEGHEGALYASDLGGVSTLAFAGRVHLYEGRSEAEVTFAVRLAADLGCEIVVLTNAAGGINPELPVGAPSLLSDHLNLTGTNPLIGPNDDAVGPRFLDLTEVYDAGLRALASSVDPELGSGVYAGLVGPTYETPAEVRMLRAMGADLVGMSTVLEAIVARYLGLRVLGISVVTNPAAGLAPEPLSHDEVAAAGRRAADRLERLLRGVLAEL
ncbi:MAG: purine-nucleoside phosphorylase [Actinomycetota bacterium]|nr:purine-nucleoside phosphorylase [Actinomycetota bacterium]